MIKKTLLIASILLFSQICNGQIAGKALLCATKGGLDNKREYMYVLGFIFGENEVTQYSYIIESDIIELIKHSSGYPYRTESDSITWIDKVEEFNFDRKTGDITHYLRLDKFSYLLDRVEHVKTCEVIDNEFLLEELMNEAKDILQERYNKSMEGNVL